MEFNPIYKVNELIDIFKEFSPRIRKNTDEGYNWLGDTDVCIEILNPNSDKREDAFTVICEDNGEFTLCFKTHSHFPPRDDEYHRMCQMAWDILTNKICAAEIRYDNTGFRSSCFLNCDRIDLQINEIFAPTWHESYEVNFSFWDLSLNKVVKDYSNVKMDVVKFDKSRAQDCLSIFDKDNSAGIVCYCTHWNMTREDIEQRILEPVKKNEVKLPKICREIAEELIYTGKTHGYLVYEDSLPVGWCNCDDKQNYIFLARHVRAETEEKIKSIVCLKVLREKNFLQVGSVLIKAICKYAKEEGYEFIEAYPHKGAMICADFDNTMQLYLLNGFQLVSLENGEAVLRKKL